MIKYSECRTEYNMLKRIKNNRNGSYIVMIDGIFTLRYSNYVLYSKVYNKETLKNILNEFGIQSINVRRELMCRSKLLSLLI